MRRNVTCVFLILILVLLLTQTVKSIKSNYKIPQEANKTVEQKILVDKYRGVEGSADKNNEFGDYYYQDAYKKKAWRERYLQVASSHYRAAIQSNPSKADYLVKLLYTKIRLGELDNDFNVLYEAAFQRGGWEHHILRGLLETGLYSSHALDNNAKKHLIVITRRLYAFNSRAVFHIAMKYGRINDVCLWTLDMERPSPLCRRTN